ncbi:MAG: hypothetical protein ACKVU1_01425 [bacterium]
MIRRTARIATLVMVGALLAGGCGESGGIGPSPDVPSSVELTYSNLGAREDSHHRAAMDATDRMLLRAETRRYAADMDSMMDAMMDSCVAMGSGGMMGDHDMRRMGDATSAMDDRIRQHHGRMDSLATLGGMRDECIEHHAEMLEVLDDMHDALPRRGMMGGGMK